MLADTADRFEETVDGERLSRLQERIEALGYDYGAPRARLSLVRHPSDSAISTEAGG